MEAMPEPEWTVLAEAGRAALLEIDRRLDLHRAVLEWRLLEAIPAGVGAASQAAAGSAQAPQGPGTPPARKPVP